MKVNINSEILKWARESVNLSIEEVVNKINKKKVTIDVIKSFENGTELPELKLAKELAKMYGINLAVLYLKYIPKNIQPKIKDFRKINSSLSRNSVFLIRKLVSHQEWVKEYLKSHNYKELDFVGSLSIIENTIESAINIIKNNLSISIDFTKNSKENFEKIREQLEDNNIFVSIGDSYNFHYTYKVPIAEIRGFAIADKIAPFIFVNSSDSDNAKLFTLIHELTHILIGETGISNDLETIDEKNSIEAYCNKVTSEFLMPNKKFIEHWNKDTDENIESKIIKLSKLFPSSRLAILIRAKSLELISENILKKYSNIFSKYENKKIVKGGNKDSRIFYIRNLNTKRFSNYVLNAYNSNTITLRDTCKLLSIKPYRLEKYIEKV